MAEAPELRWYGLDCSPLGTRRLWLLMGTLGDRPTEDLGVLVVAPSDAARQILEAGDGTFVAQMGDEDSLVSLRLDTIDPIDDVRLERALLMAYDACFGEPRSDRTQPPCQ
jgi:hypothetical protein